MQANDTHIKWIPGDIDNEFWYDQITEALHHCEWVTEWTASWTVESTEWRIGIHNEENFLCWVLPIDILTYLRKAWKKGDRSFEEEQQVDQDVIDTMLQIIVFGELVYG